MIENMGWMLPEQARHAYRTPSYDGSLWGPDVCRCGGNVDPHRHTPEDPYGRSIYAEPSVPYVPGPSGATRVYRSAYTRPSWDSRTASYWPVQVLETSSPPPAAVEDDEEDAGWKAALALLGLCLLVSAVGVAAFGWPLP